MSSLREYKAFGEGRLEIDCPLIILSSSNGEYRGPGGIVQGDGGTLSFKMHCQSEPSGSVSQMLGRISRATPGKLIPTADLFDLVATDYTGTNWKAHSISPNTTSYSTTGRTLIRGSLRSLYQEQPVAPPLRNAVILTFFDQNTSEWDALLALEHCIGAPYTGYNVECSKAEQGQVSFSLRSHSSLPEDCWFRVVEALRFVLADLVSPSIVEECGGAKRKLTLYARPPRSRSQQMPPIRTGWRKNQPEALRMFERYLQLVTTEAAKGFSHPCSAHLSHAIEASANSAEAWAVGLCVAFEGIAGLLPNVVSPEDTKAAAKARRVASMLLKRSNFSLAFQGRVRGVLGQLANARVQDRLQPLAHSGFFDSKHLDAWKALRHRRVHGAMTDPTEFDDAEIQRTIDQIMSITVGVYQMVFYLMGYTGIYSDYSLADSDKFAYGTYPRALGE